MIQKKTWILLIIFIFLLGLLLLVEKTPSLTTSFRTPSPTSYPKLLSDWSSVDITKLEVKDKSGQVTVVLERNADLSWISSSIQKFEVDQGKVQGLLASLFSLEIMQSLETTSQLGQFGLIPPVYTITIQNNVGEKKVINIGDETPTSRGYYVQLNNFPPVVTSKYGMEGILQLLAPETLMLQDETLQLSPGTQTTP